MDWTAEAIDRLRAFWAEGHSTAEIGRRMGITKNAVVGKAHRLNLSARPSPIRREAEAAGRPAPGFHRHAAPAIAAPWPISPQPARPEPRHATAAAPLMPAQPVALPAPRAAAPGPASAVASLPLMVMRPFPRLTNRSCCWPMGDPGTTDFRFCSGEATTGKPYCADHVAVAYVKARDRREDAA